MTPEPINLTITKPYDWIAATVITYDADGRELERAPAELRNGVIDFPNQIVIPNGGRFTIEYETR